jgi:hypothetical protein
VSCRLVLLNQEGVMQQRAAKGRVSVIGYDRLQGAGLAKSRFPPPPPQPRYNSPGAALHQK